MDKNETEITSAPQKTVENRRKKGGLKRHLTRLISIILAVAMVTSALVYRETAIESPEEMERRLGSAAARRLLENSAYANADRLSRMVMYAKYVLGTNNTYEDYVLGADICIAGGDFRSAAELTAGAIRTCTDKGEALAGQYFRAGYLYTLTGDRDTAVEHLNMGLKIRDDAEALSVKALLHAERGETEEAKKAIERYAKLCTAENADAVAGNTALRAEAYEAAETIFNLLAEKGDRDTLLYRGVSLSLQGKYEAAEADFESYAADGGKLAAAKLIPAQTRMRNGDYAGALKLFSEALEFSDADRKSIYAYMTLCAYHGEDYAATLENAKAYFAQESTEVSHGKISVTLKPVDEREMNKMAGAACLNLQMYEPALEYLDRYLAAGNENASADSELRATVEAIRLELKNQ